MSSDERLALRAAEGDERAFEEIYRRYNQDLYRFCLAMVGNPADAQDAVQNTMVKVLRALPGEKREIKLKPWLYRIARNESVETLRRRRGGVELEAQQAATGSVTEAAEARERLRMLLVDLAQLPERQRAALVMRELAGLDFGQIGLAFGTSAAVARQTLYEARLSLRQLEAGREMRCADVMRELSDGDGRVTRRREVRAHLDSCSDCRAFRDEISKRQEDLAALAPLPLAASAGLIHAALSQAGGVGSAGGGTAGALTAAAGKVAANSAIFKVTASVAILAAVGVSADRSGLVDLRPSTGGHSRVQEAATMQGPDGMQHPANPQAPGGVHQPEDRGRSQTGSDAAPADGGEARRQVRASSPADESHGRQGGRGADEDQTASKDTASTHGPSRSQQQPTERKPPPRIAPSIPRPVRIPANRMAIAASRPR
jgi:RNA polymerase sigma factor (sigma-70 family)